MARVLKYADKASQAMVKRAAQENIEIVWDRYEAMQPQCGFGSLGICCKICNMGPCRIDPFGEGPQEGDDDGQSHEPVDDPAHQAQLTQSGCGGAHQLPPPR